VLKWRHFSFIFNRGNRKVWGGDESHVVSGKKIPGEKGSVKRVRCRNGTASSFVA
jgi:hypothetical protein